MGRNHERSILCRVRSHPPRGEDRGGHDAVHGDLGAARGDLGAVHGDLRAVRGDLGVDRGDRAVVRGGRRDEVRHGL